MTFKESWALAKQQAQQLKDCPHDQQELKALRLVQIGEAAYGKAPEEWVHMEVIGKRQLTRYLNRGWEHVTAEVSLFNAHHRYILRKRKDAFRLDTAAHAVVR